LFRLVRPKSHIVSFTIYNYWAGDIYGNLKYFANRTIVLYNILEDSRKIRYAFYSYCPVIEPGIPAA